MTCSPRLPLLLLLGLLLPAAWPAEAKVCRVEEPELFTGYRDDSTNAVNLDLNDYGRIHADADDPDCAAPALSALESKLAKSLSSSPAAFRRWLDSYNLALIMSASTRLGNQGWAMAGPCPDPGEPLNERTPLHCLLSLVRDRFESGVLQPPVVPCGIEVYPVNNCVDDHAGDASAYA
ncbi:MAG TPA: hypothetical protein VM534_01425, partial [Thermoanaerobaculia bacterium]|nr:hypothetical protein [Thermoanaerobaculia bacterium]